MDSADIITGIMPCAAGLVVQKQPIDWKMETGVESIVLSGSPYSTTAP